MGDVETGPAGRGAPERAAGTSAAPGTAVVRETVQTVDTIVIGAGISGLAYAHARGAADVVVLEASARAGGLVRTERVDEVHYECGPEALQDDAAPTHALIAELGLRPVPASPAAARRYILRAAPPRRVHDPRAPHDARARVLDDAAAFDAFSDRHGALDDDAPPPPEPLGELVALPTDPAAFLTSPLLSRRGRMRALLEPVRARGVALDGSVADFVRHRLGEEVLDWLVDPFVSGLYAGDPELLSLRAAFPRLHAMVAEHGSVLRGLKARARERRAAGGPRRRTPSLLTVEGGLEEIPRAIAARLGGRLRLRCAGRRVAPRGDGWEVQLAPGAGPPIAARRVVLAVPAPAAAHLVAQDVPELSQPLASIRAESVVSVCHLWRRQDVAHPLDGFGYLVPSRLGMAHLGTLFSSSIEPGRCGGGRVLLRTLLGGARHPGLVQADPDELRAIVAEEVGAVLGLGGEPLWSTVVAWPAVLPRYDLDQPARQDTIDAVLARRPGLFVLGNHRRGISVNALVETARELAREHRGGPAA